MVPGLDCARSGVDRQLLLPDTMAPGAMPKKHARDTRKAVAGLAGMAAVLLVVACGEGNGGAPCLPEDVERCTCVDGRDGFQVCALEAGAGYGACNCDLDASPYLPEAGEEASDDGSEGDGNDGGGGLVFMSPCSLATGAPQCPPGTSCDNFPSKGPHCSKPCTIAMDCPPPSPGCTPMGMCKAP
jgi:hypothetical protein